MLVGRQVWHKNWFLWYLVSIFKQDVGQLLHMRIPSCIPPLVQELVRVLEQFRGSLCIYYILWFLDSTFGAATVNPACAWWHCGWAVMNPECDTWPIRPTTCSNHIVRLNRRQIIHVKEMRGERKRRNVWLETWCILENPSELWRDDPTGTTSIVTSRSWSGYSQFLSCSSCTWQLYSAAMLVLVC